MACRRPIEKNVIGKLHHFTYGFLVQAISLPLSTLLVIYCGQLLNPLRLGLSFWLPVLLVSAGFYPLNVFLYKKAIKDGELSKVLPLQSLGPVFALLLAWLSLGEVPGTIATIGVIITVFGIYALGLKGRRLHHPLRPFKEDSSSRAMLAGVLLVAFASVLDKIAIQASNPLFYSLVSTIGAAMTLYMAMRMGKQKLTSALRPLIRQITTIGLLQGGTYTTYILAIAAGPIAYVSALRGTNILMGSILGIIIFREKLTKPKLISYALIIIGATFLAFGSSH